MPSETELIERIRQIKDHLVTLGDLRPGSLSEQYNVCGTPGCRCKADPPHKHGPYYQLSYTRKGRSRTESVRAEHVADVKAQIAAYQQLRALIDAWVDAGIELDRLRRGPSRRRAA